MCLQHPLMPLHPLLWVRCRPLTLSPMKPVLCAECHSMQHIKRASVVKGLMHLHSPLISFHHLIKHPVNQSIKLRGTQILRAWRRTDPQNDLVFRQQGAGPPRGNGRKTRSNRCDLSNFRNGKVVWALCIGTGRAFHKAGPAMEKALVL